MDPQLKKGILKICILKLICQEDMYGYDVVKIMQRYFNDTEESTLYAIMRRLSNENLTEVYYGDISKGPKRKYYRITDEGKKYLMYYIESWKEIESIFLDMEILSEYNISKKTKGEKR